MSQTDPSAPSTSSSAADELADKLFERRERLAYFLVTAGTAIIAFAVTQLNTKDGPLRKASVLWLAVGWLGLLLSAGSSLMLIWKRHQAYALYLDTLYKGPTPSDKRDKVQESVQHWQMSALILFFVGSAIEVATWADAIWSARS